MELLSRFWEFVGIGVGIPAGIIVGYLLFIHFEHVDDHIKETKVRSFHELDTIALLDLLPEVPLWVKHPDYERIDWLNKFISNMWPFLDKAICNTIKSYAEPLFTEYFGKYQISAMDFEGLTLGSLPPVIHGIKVHQSNENELVLETAVRWAGNPKITLVLKVFSVQVKLQLFDVQVYAATRIVLKPLVPTFPCFANITVSLLEKPQIDFGLKIYEVDLMAVPGLYHYIQETIRNQVASFYLWPLTFDLPILDSAVGATKKPIGILHVKIVKAMKLLKKDLLGASDPYVKLSLSGERLSTKKTSVKMKTLNPEWNENFKLAVKDLKSQVLELRVYDWEKIGSHDKLGMQVIPLRGLKPHECKEYTVDLLKNRNPNDAHNKRPRGKLVIEMRFNPFRAENERFSGPLESDTVKSPSAGGAHRRSDSVSGLLLVTVEGAEDIEGKHHTNLYALIIFRGEQRKTKTVKRTQHPYWNEEFQFLLEEPPLQEKLRIEVMSKRTLLSSIRSKESLGYADINLTDVVDNGHIHDKFHLINSRNGVIHVNIRWTCTVSC